MTSNAKVFLGVIAAATAGAVIGMVFAPAKGSDLRKKVKSNVSGIADELYNVIKNGKDTYNNLSEKAGNLKGTAKHKINELATDALDTLYNKKTEVQSL